MTGIAAVNGIGMLYNGVVGMNFGAVMVLLAAMRMRCRQMHMRRQPLDRQEDGQQNKITREMKALLVQVAGGVFNCDALIVV